MPINDFYIQSAQYKTDAPAYIQGMQQLRQRADASNAAIAEMEGAIGDLQSYDTEAKKQVLNKFRGDIEGIVDQYNGDIARATPHIIRRLGNERTSEFYNLNRIQQEEAKKFDALVAKYGKANVQFADPRKQLLTTEEGRFRRGPEEIQGLMADVGQREDLPMYIEKKYA